MNEWMNELVDEWVGDWMNGCSDDLFENLYQWLNDYNVDVINGSLPFFPYTLIHKRVHVHTKHKHNHTQTHTHTKKNQAQSKGGILAKTVEYITELKMANSRLSEQAKDYENCNMDIEMLRQQVNCNMNINKAK